MFSGPLGDVDICATRWFSGIALDWGESVSRESKDTMVNALQNVGVREVGRVRSNT